MGYRKEEEKVKAVKISTFSMGGLRNINWVVLLLSLRVQHCGLESWLTDNLLFFQNYHVWRQTITWWKMEKREGKRQITYLSYITPSLKQRANRYCLKLINQINRSITIPRTMEKNCYKWIRNSLFKVALDMTEERNGTGDCFSWFCNSLTC